MTDTLELLMAPQVLSREDKVTPGNRLRCAWIVTAGIIPGTAMQEFTRRWMITSEAWEHENSISDEEFNKEFPDGSTFMRFKDEAYTYAKNLGDPRRLNWVRVDWIWY